MKERMRFEQRYALTEYVRENFLLFENRTHESVRNEIKQHLGFDVSRYQIRKIAQFLGVDWHCASNTKYARERDRLEELYVRVDRIERFLMEFEDFEEFK